jgi:hypothetical protein
MIKTAFAIALLTVALSACIYAEPGPPAGVVVPPGVVYVAPTYERPGPGWDWRYNHEHGWGWYHPEHGWHKGWR